MMYATNWTIGVSPDTIIYIKVARNIISGQGLNIAAGEPLTHYPPLYPAFLALSGLMGFDPLDGARWLHAFLAAANVLLIATIIYRETNGSIMASAFGALFMISSLPMLFIHQQALSETLYIMLTLSGFFILAALVLTLFSVRCLNFGLIILKTFGKTVHSNPANNAGNKCYYRANDRKYRAQQAVRNEQTVDAGLRC